MGARYPETRYVSVGDAEVAYQIVGNGPLDLCYFVGVGHIDGRWDHPLFADTFEALASFSRLILFDRRGTGASDPVPNNALPTWEEWADDLRAVLDAAGSDRTAICAEADGGPIGTLFAAMHPDRVTGLVLANTSARLGVADDYPIGVAPEVWAARVERTQATWGREHPTSMFPGRTDDIEFARWFAKIQRASMTPRQAVVQMRNYWDFDVREVLPLIQVPTLVLHGRGNAWFPVEHGRYLADHIAGARFVELDTDDAYCVGSGVAIDEIAEFLTGERPTLGAERILTTVLFTDIVGSTQHAATLGDPTWRSYLDAHDHAVRDQLRRFRGREVKMTGDGFLASFDGPARAIRCASAIAEAVRGLGIQVRTGLHTGECEVRGDDLAGMAVHIAARVGALACAGEVLVSSTVKDLVVGSGIEFEDRGEHELKGVPGTWRLYAVRA